MAAKRRARDVLKEQAKQDAVVAEAMIRQAQVPTAKVTPRSDDTPSVKGVLTKSENAQRIAKKHQREAIAKSRKNDQRRPEDVMG
jgi:hypothetical protein